MKALILVCAFVATSMAAPKNTRTTKLDPKLAPQVEAAEQAWTAAEAETDAAQQEVLWERAAVAFGEVDGAAVETKVKRAAAYAAIMAWKNALKPPPPATARDDGKPAPKPLPAREQKLVAAIDRYAKYADATDTDLPGVLFLKANTYRRFDQLELAIPILRSLIERFPRADVGELAANLLLDSYNRLEQYDKLVALANQLAKDAAFLSDRDDLAHLVAMILRRSKSKHAEELERDAKATKDWDTYIAAATAYVEIYNADRESRENDETLYNAGVMYEEGRAIGQAIQMYLQLGKYYPNSRITMRAMARLARLYGDIAMYDKAAAQLELYATRYAGEKDAYDAMSDAVFYRRALGDRAKAIDDTKYFIKTFGAKRVVEAANASWSLTALYEPDADATIKHLREYIRTYGEKGGRDRLLIAHAKLGALLWKQSCPHALVDGLCVKVKERTPRTCGAGTTRTMTATKRDVQKAKDAFAAFAATAKQFERPGDRFDDPETRYHYAQTKLAQADFELEAYLADTQVASQPFDAWLAAKRDAGARVSGQYDAVLAIKDPATAITAMARRATISQALAGALVTGTGRRDCDARTSAAAELETSAVQAFAVCLATSTQLGWFETSAAYCEQQLVALKPDDFPRARERRSRPSFAAPVLALEPAIR